MSQADHDLFVAEYARFRIHGGIHQCHPVFFVRAADRIRFTNFLSEELNKRPATKNGSGRWEVRTPSDGWLLQVENGPLISFDYIITTYDADTQTKRGR